MEQDRAPDQSIQLQSGPHNEITGSVFGISVQAGAIHGDVHLHGRPAEFLATKFAGAPYRGLLPFDQGHRGVFYGRERLTDELVDRVAAQLTGPGLLLVTGASGAGKSSLVQAGLVPAVAAGRLTAGCQSWPRLVMTPTARPVDELAARLAGLAGVTASSVRDILLERPDEVGLFIRQAVLAATATDDHPASPRLLLVVDQFEELFTLIPDTQPDAIRQREAFLAALCAAATTGVGPTDQPALLVVLAVRSDFWHHCLAVPALGELMRDGQFIVGPMTEPELRRAITGPATTAGLQVEPELTDVVLSDLRAMSSPTGFDVGALPLLSQAMLMTWEHRAGDRLTIQAYSTTGGVANAITTSAERVYTSLSPDDQAITKTVFHQLATVNGNGLATRRTTTRAALHASTPDRVDAILQAFADERLLILNNGNVDLAHDALLTAWPRLQDWLAEDYTDHLIHHQLLDDASRWQHSNHDRAFLYRGTELTNARNAITRWDTNPDRHPTPTPLIRQFLHISTHADRRTAKLRRTAITAVTLLIIATSVTAVIAYTTAQQARDQQQIALSRQLAAQADAITDINPGLAQRLAAAAWRIHPTGEAHYSMLNALATRHRTVLPNHEGAVVDVAFSPDRKTLATANQDEIVRLWDVATQEQIGDPLTGHEGSVESLAFSPDGSTLATAGGDGTVRLWEVGTQEQVGAPLTGHQDAVSGVAFSPDRKTLASASSDRTVRLWDVATHKQIGDALTGHRDTVEGVAFSPDGSTLATASRDATVRLWNVATRRQLGDPLTGHQGIAFSVVFSPDGSTLATASGDGTVRLWNVATQEQIGDPLTGHQDGVGRVVFSPDGSALASASWDGTVRLWDVATYRQIDDLTGHQGTVFGVDFSPDGSALATSGSDGTVRLWGVATRRQLGDPLTGHQDTVFGVVFSPDGSALASASWDGTVRLWDVATQEQIGDPLTGHQDGVSRVDFSPDGSALASASWDGTVRLWDVATQEQIGDPLTGHQDAVSAVVFSPDGLTLASAGYDGAVRLWDLASRQQIDNLTGHQEAVSDVVFSADGKILASASWDGTVRLWDVATHEQIGDPLTGHQDAVSAVVFSADGKILASASWDGTVRLWDVATHEQIGDPLTGHQGDVESVAFSPDRTTLATAGDDETVRLWDSGHDPDPRSTICRYAGSISEDEWAQRDSGEPRPQVC